MIKVNENYINERMKLSPQNGIITGTIGTGKSLIAKAEMVQLLENTGDYVVVISSTDEYKGFASIFQGSYIPYSNIRDFQKSYMECDPLDSSNVAVNRLICFEVENSQSFEGLIVALEEFASKIKDKLWVYIENADFFIKATGIATVAKRLCTARTKNVVYTLVSQQLALSCSEILVNCPYVAITNFPSYLFMNKSSNVTAFKEMGGNKRYTNLVAFGRSIYDIDMVGCIEEMYGLSNMYKS